MGKKEELKSCPFCKAISTITKDEDFTKFECYVLKVEHEADCIIARHFGINGKITKMMSNSPDALAIGWNYRPAEDAKDKEIERLKGVIAEIAATLATCEEFHEDDVFTLCKDTIGEKQILDRYNKKLRERASKLGKDTHIPTDDADTNVGSMEKNKMIRKEIKQDGMVVYDYVCNKVKESCEASHAYNVAMNTFQIVNKDDYFCVALLHDIVEDGYATFEELQQRFSLNDEQMAALDAITRRQGEKYFDYIQRVKQNEMATTVKLADLQHNIYRCANDLRNRWGLLRRYAKAYAMLIDEWKDC